MRLYLSSFRLGDKTDELVRLFGQGKRVAVIANATDLATAEERKRKVETEFELLNNLGFVTEEIDLRDYFSKEDGLRAQLEKFDSAWVRGGNVFLLRRAFKQSGFDGILAELLKEDKIAYGGYSAGSCVLAPTLHGLELVDEPLEIAEGYMEEIVWEGLDLIPYSVAPHYKSDHPESPLIDKVVEYFEENGIAYKSLSDGDAIVISS